MFSRIGITKFYYTCRRGVMQEEYHPLYLSRDYFVEKEIDGETVLKPAVSKTSFVPFVKRNIIQDLGWCYPLNKDIDVFLESGYIVICREAHKNQWKVKQLLQDHKVKTLAKINTSQYYLLYGWLNKLLRTEFNMYMCGEHKIYNNGNISVVPYENYIKLKKNTNVKEVN